MKRKAWGLLAALLLAVLLPVVCLAETAVASFYPIYVMALNLTQGIDGITVSCLADNNTGCLHDYQLQTGDMKKLAAADIFLINGAGMEEFLDLVTEALPELPVADASRGISLLTAEDMPVVLGEMDTEVNAHIWLDVSNARQMCSNLCEDMIRVWPQHREALEKNRDAYDARLAALDTELREGLAGTPRKDIITFHEAFPYFARAYGLNVAAVVCREPGDTLSPRQLSALILQVMELGNPPLFVEPQYDDIAAQTVSQETGAAIYELDPCVTGPMDEGAFTAYEDAMRQNLMTLQAALGGA